MRCGVIALANQPPAYTFRLVLCTSDHVTRISSVMRLFTGLFYDVYSCYSYLSFVQFFLSTVENLFIKHTHL